MDEIESAYKQKNYELLVKLLNSYVLLNDNDRISKANYYLGSYHEFHDDSKSRYLSAAQYYRRALEFSPMNYIRLGLVALLIKSRNTDFDEIKKLLDDVRSEVNIPVVDLGYAAIYFYRIPPDYRQSKMYFIKAARRGAIFGMFGYSICSRKLRQPIRAAIVDLVRIILSPILKLFLGQESSLGYFWSNNLEPFLEESKKS